MIRPILFNTDMVRAILTGRKTATRRRIDIDISNQFDVEHDRKTVIAYIDPKTGDSYNPAEICRYQPGDIMYVRETWQHLYELDGNEEIIEGTGKYYYAATDSLPSGGYVDSRGSTHETIPWKPSIYMPKAAARIWLKVTDVRVERLQNITEEQAKAEGAVRCYEELRPDEDNPVIYQSEEEGGYYVLGFKAIWNSTVKKPDIEKYGWDANPWVWVIEFERCEIPEKLES